MLRDDGQPKTNAKKATESTRLISKDDADDQEKPGCCYILMSCFITQPTQNATDELLMKTAKHMIEVRKNNSIFRQDIGRLEEKIKTLEKNYGALANEFKLFSVISRNDSQPKKESGQDIKQQASVGQVSATGGTVVPVAGNSITVAPIVKLFESNRNDAGKVKGNTNQSANASGGSIVYNINVENRSLSLF